jgi:hypothetical protein
MAKGFYTHMTQSEKKYVKFRHNCSPYLAGEVGLFPIVASLKLVVGANPIGYYVKKNDKGEWVPDKGEDNDDNKPADQDGSGEQTDPPTEDEGQGTEIKTAPVPKTGGQGRRQRAKL